MEEETNVKFHGWKYKHYYLAATRRRSKSKIYVVVLQFSLISANKQHTKSQHASIYRCLSKRNNYEADFLFGYFPMSYLMIKSLLYNILLTSIYGIPITLGFLLLFENVISSSCIRH